MRSTFELAFEVSPLTDDLEDSIDEQFDAVMATHGRTTKVTLLAEGTDAVDAAGSAVSILRQLGIQAIRLMDDLVTRAEIAERSGVTTQGVGLWVRGERNRADFPEPFVRAGSARLWLWGEVVDYLRAIGHGVDGSLQFPTRQDIQVIAGMLAPTRHHDGGYTAFATRRAVVHTRIDGVGATPITETGLVRVSQEYAVEMVAR